MKLTPMRFGNFQWPHNPSQIKITSGRDLYEVGLAGSGGILQDRGCKRRVITGSGELYGEGCFRQYQEICNLLRAGKSDLLTLPGVTPFRARFVSLELTGEPEPDLLHYRFVFWEESGETGQVEDSHTEQVYCCKGGENLWRIAQVYQTTVEILTDYNPHLRWVTLLDAGEEVRIP